MTLSNVRSVDWDDVCARLVSVGLTAEREHPLAPYTTYAVGGVARCAVRVADAADARLVGEVLSEYGHLRCVVIGRGSNMLVSDAGFDGVAVLTSTGASLDDVSLEGDLVCAAGGTPMPVLARRSSALGRAGLEWAVGIPGTVGGAVRMNAGGHGSDMREAVVDVDVVSLWSGHQVRVSGNDLGFHFRGSVLTDRHIVVSARLRSVDGDPDDCAEEISRIVAWRRQNQPGGRNAGSVFVNPGDAERSAGALIDACGLRGRRHGSVEVSDKHANFILAHDGATASDVVELMCEVQDRVELVHGVRLRSEVRLVGFADEMQARFADPRHELAGHRAQVQRLAVLMGEGGDRS